MRKNITESFGKCVAYSDSDYFDAGFRVQRFYLEN